MACGQTACVFQGNSAYYFFRRDSGKPAEKTFGPFWTQNNKISCRRVSQSRTLQPPSTSVNPNSDANHGGFLLSREGVLQAVPSLVKLADPADKLQGPWHFRAVRAIATSRHRNFTLRAGVLLGAVRRASRLPQRCLPVGLRRLVVGGVDRLRWLPQLSDFCGSVGVSALQFRVCKTVRRGAGRARRRLAGVL